MQCNAVNHKDSIYTSSFKGYLMYVWFKRTTSNLFIQLHLKNRECSGIVILFLIVDVIVLNDIIEQASRRPSARRSTIAGDGDGPR